MNSKIILTFRIVLAIILIAFGANKYLNFMPSPEGSPTEAINFMSAIIETGYLWKFIGAVEVFSGLMLLANKWVPFALLLVAPIAVNIILFHLFLDISTILPGLIVFTLVVLLFYQNWNNYKPLFKG